MLTGYRPLGAVRRGRTFPMPFSRRRRRPLPPAAPPDTSDPPTQRWTAVRKAVIPAAGLGTRFLPASKATPKEMIPLVDKPAIQYVVEEAVSCGIRDILIVTGRNKSPIEDHFDRSPELEANLASSGKEEALREMVALAELADIHFVRQGEPRGLGHAVAMARDHVGNEPFAVLLGDDIMHERAGVLQAMIDSALRYGTSVIALKEVTRDEISSYGSVRMEPLEGQLVRVLDMVEKPRPDDAPSLLAMIGRYVLSPEIFDAIDRTGPGAGGEIQLTDAIRRLIDGPGVLGWTFREGRYDAGNKLDFLRATVDLALEREDLGPPLREHLARLLNEPDTESPGAQR
jgi:UTP--glucose-1-phosphate uridylyltransferase